METETQEMEYQGVGSMPVAAFILVGIVSGRDLLGAYVAADTDFE